MAGDDQVQERTVDRLESVLKSGNTDRLQDELVDLARSDPQGFNKTVELFKQKNDADRATNKLLPGLEIHNGSDGKAGVEQVVVRRTDGTKTEVFETAAHREREAAQRHQGDSGKWSDLADYQKDSSMHSADSKALALIEKQIVDTATKIRAAESHPAVQDKVPPKTGTQVHGIFDAASWQAIGGIVENLKPGDQNQKFVSDLGIEQVPTVDLKNSRDTTKALDNTLAASHIDPHNYNCNDYVRMFVHSQESQENLQAYVRGLNHPSVTDSPERFLREHKFGPIAHGSLREGDILVVHGPVGQHAAVVCKDTQTGELYTMQKPNPKELPVRLSLDQFSRAEKVSASRVEAYRKQ